MNAPAAAPSERHELDLSPIGLDWRGLLPFAVAVAVFSALAGRYWYVVMDDPYITFRYARNVLAGDGWAFNPGQPLEGYSNFLWLVLSMVPIAMGIEPLGAMRVAGIGFAVGLLAWLCFAPRGWGRYRLAAPLLASCYPFAVWAIGGLETPMYALLAFAAVVFTNRTVHGPGRGSTAALAASLLAVALSRPEGAMVLALPLVALVCARGGARRHLLAAIAVFAAGFAVYTLWRLATFGTMIPNTVSAKVGGSPVRSAVAGIKYTAAYFLAPPLVLLGLAVWGAWKDRSHRPLFLIGGTWVGLQILFTILVGGDWMPGMRFLVPMLPVLCVLAAIGLYRLPRWAWVAVPAVLILAAPIHARFEAIQGWRPLEWARRNAWDPEVPGRRALIIEQPLRMGRDIAAIVPTGETIALTEAGAVPWVADRPVIDMLGLVDAEIAQVGGALHEAFDAQSVLRREPDWILLGVVEPEPGTMTGVWPPDQQILLAPGFQSAYAEARRWPRGFPLGLNQQPGAMVLFERTKETTTR